MKMMTQILLNKKSKFLGKMTVYSIVSFNKILLGNFTTKVEWPWLELILSDFVGLVFLNIQVRILCYISSILYSVSQKAIDIISELKNRVTQKETNKSSNFSYI